MYCKQMLDIRMPALFVFLAILVPTALTNTAFLIPPKSQHFFELANAVSMHDVKRSSAEEASYIFRGQLKVNSVWNTAKEQLLEVFITYSKVSAPAKLRKTSVTAEVTKIPDRPFYVSIIDGKPHKVIAHTSRDQSLLNLERGFASLLQLEYKNGPVTEVDVSGKCNAFYAVKSSMHIEKIKTDCSHWDLKVNYRAEKALGITQVSQEIVEYELSPQGTLKQAISSEKHRISLASKPDVGSEVSSQFSLTHLVESSDVVKQLEFDTLDAAVKSLLEWYRVFDIEADVDGAISEIKGESLKKRLSTLDAEFQSERIGNHTLALAIAELLPLARITKQDEFIEILQAHKDSIAPIIDLLAAVQSIDAHNAITELYKFNSDEEADAELLEHYLQSLAVGTHPERAIIEDLYNRLHVQNESDEIKNDKLRDTVIQAVAALTRQSGFDDNDSLLKNVRKFLLENLYEKCEDTGCKIIFIRALQNLQDVSTLSTLFKSALTGEAAESVAALQALKSFPITNFNEQHRRSFAEIFYQTKRKYDTTARVIALDILIALKPTKEELNELLNYLNSNDHHYEIKTFVIQKLRMIADKCQRFKALLNSCLAELPEVNNYHVIGQKGLTTVLTRELSKTPAFNESLLSVQEIYQGVLKRGTVELLLGADKDEFSSFKIGIYTTGLTSLVGDDVPEDELDDSPTTAGMEITVQGVLLRPLVFFSSQGELMGHVWSGTASDPTAAYQATVLAEDHEHYIILSSGATVYMRVVGTRSVDLSGKVEFSLWNRNANTEINQTTGAAIVGHMVAGFTYAKVENKFTVTSEPRITLQAHLDFYSGIKLCLKLQRPDMLLNQSNVKSVFLAPNSYYKHIRTKTTHNILGRTLALNQKNNEMCNLIFGDY